MLIQDAVISVHGAPCNRPRCGDWLVGAPSGCRLSIFSFDVVTGLYHIAWRVLLGYLVSIVQDGFLFSLEYSG